MAKQILQVNFKFNISRSELENRFRAGATRWANVPGLLWKIWLMNEAEKETGGIYLFDDKSSAQKYLEGEIFAMLKNNPAVSNISVKQFETIEDLTKITHGPVELITPKS
jgi:hypothetical protein